MIVKLATLLCLLQSCGAYSSSKISFRDIELQTLYLDHRGDHIGNELQLVNHETVEKRKSNKHNITSVTPLIISNNGVVQLRFSAHKPEETDWIGAYSPANADVTRTVPVKFAFCKADPKYLTNGSGLLRFNFTNLREDVTFHYFTGSLVSPVLVATYENKLSFSNNNEQLRPRMVPVGSINHDSFKLLWNSASSETAALKWGVKPGVYDRTVPATTSQISRSDMCGKPANSTGWRDLGLTHTALLTGMSSLGGSPIYYIFGDTDTNNFSEEMVFHVPTPRGKELAHRPTKVILYDDMGRGSMDDSFTWNEYGRPSYLTANAVGAEVARGDIDAVYHGGDISYAMGYMAVWDFFLNMISPISSKVLYLTTVGNHESDYPHSASYYKGTDSGGECGILATTLIPLPHPATKDKPWWSYDIGLIHFVGMSTEHDFRIKSDQHSWLESDLASVDRSVTPWIVFGGHRAMYVNSGYGGDDSSDASVMDLLILHVEPLLLKYRVNLGFYGHNHVVQRQSAVYKKKVIQRSVEVESEDGTVHTFRNPGATVHMVVGTAGAGFTKNAVTPLPDWNEMFFYKWGYARLTAHNSTNLSWEWVESESGSVFDRMAISQVTDFKANPNWLVDDDNSPVKWEHSIRDHVIKFFKSYGLIILAVLVIALLSGGGVVCVKMFFLTPSSSSFSSSARSAGTDVYRKLPSPDNGLDRSYLRELDNSTHSEDGFEVELRPEPETGAKASLVENII